MDKRTRLMVLGAAGLVVALVGAYMLWPSGGSEVAVDPAVVQAAAESSRQQQQQEPVQDEPKREGRARPGAMGVGGGAPAGR